METLSNTIRQTLPNYLSNLPIPNSIGGWFKLGVKDWASLIPFGVVCGGLGYMTYVTFCPVSRRNLPINPGIDKGTAKVVHTKDIEELGEINAFCRCWKSKEFPMCDGSHNQHNEKTGDNVGPLVVKMKKKK